MNAAVNTGIQVFFVHFQFFWGLYLGIADHLGILVSISRSSGKRSIGHGALARGWDIYLHHLLRAFGNLLLYMYCTHFPHGETEV